MFSFHRARDSCTNRSCAERDVVLRVARYRETAQKLTRRTKKQIKDSAMPIFVVDVSPPFASALFSEGRGCTGEPNVRRTNDSRCRAWLVLLDGGFVMGGMSVRCSRYASTHTVLHNNASSDVSGRKGLLQCRDKEKTALSLRSPCPCSSFKASPSSWQIRAEAPSKKSRSTAFGTHHIVDGRYCPQ